MPPFDGLTTQAEVLDAFDSDQLAVTLAEAEPAQIVIASRSFSKVEPVIQTIKSTDRSIKTSFVQVDLSDHVSVRKAAAEILEAAPGIDVLIKSVGNMAIKDYTLDKRAIEMQVSVNHVGYFPLTNLLVPALRAAATRSDGKGARVVNLTGDGGRRTGYNDDTALARHLTWADLAEIEPVARANTGRGFVWEEPRPSTRG
ncbi:hypothetical protein KJ359_006391 [Pestalotiopsis sp. 9143b]|nr:hypothetical protein KJ359_006391 [Pestalotiopsis sp. 9143b]